VVPKLGALITMSVNGVMHIFKPGWGIRFPWEQVHYDIDVISQRVKKVSKGSQFIVEGIPFTFNWTAQWGPFLPLLPLNIRFDEGDVEAGVREIVENTISQATLGCKEGEILTEAKIVQIQGDVLKALEGGPGMETHLDAFGNTIEERVGANIEIGTLGPPALNADYQQAKVVAKTAEQMTAQAKRMAEELGIEGGVAMNNVMILNRETDVKKNIVEVDVSKRAGAAAEDIGRILGVAGGIASKLPDNASKGATT
jgi:hypothetical protein